MPPKKKSEETKRREAKERMKTLRQNEEHKREEQMRNTTAKRICRQDPEARILEQSADTSARAKRREDPVVRNKEQVANTSARAKRRENSVVRNLEQESNSSARAKRRKDPTVRKLEQEADTSARAKRRQDPVVRNLEQDANTSARAKQRENSVVRNLEQESNSSARANRRKDHVVRNLEQEADTSARAKRRQDPVVRNKEQVANTSARVKQRENSVVRNLEQKADTSARARRRQDSTIRNKEKEANTSARAKRRQDETFRTPEKKADSQSHFMRRQDDTLRTPERIRDATARRHARDDPARRQLDLSSDTRSKNKKKKAAISQYEKLYSLYLADINEGPTLFCSCCGGTFYRKSLTKTCSEKLRSKGYDDHFMKLVLCVQQEQHWFCSTCNEKTRKRNEDSATNIPRACLSNGLQFPEVPSSLMDLNRLEERMVAPYVPFMQIRLKGYEQQWALKGNVVNVENNLDKCVSVLPRRFDETSVIQLQLMRRMCYTGYYIYDKVRPSRIISALNYLLETPLYKKSNIVLSENWEEEFNTYEVNFIVDDDAPPLQQQGELAQQSNPPMNKSTTDAEADVIENDGCEETLIFNDRDPSAYGRRFAPAEGNTPQPLFQDKNSELLAFPTIYCGIERTLRSGVKLSYTDIAKSELRRFDRRCARPEKILYMFKKSFNEKVKSAYDIGLRQKKKLQGGETLKAKDVLTEEGISKALHNDDGYRVFKHVRSSPAYWKEQSKRVVAMVRQLGTSTFFITLSAAETKWSELLIMLSQLVDNVQLTHESASSLSYQTKARLIRSDPATCMRHFDHRYKSLLNMLFKKECGVFEPQYVNDHYSRIEFQLRGSPHSHGLYWLNDAPKYKPDDPGSAVRCVEFINKHITCRRDEDGEMKQLIKYQFHRHSHTCRKGSRSINFCRFQYPKPPMPETQILTPLSKEVDKEISKCAVENFKKIWLKLDSMGLTFSQQLSFNAFLESLHMTFEDYILAIRSSVKRSTVFLKRNPNEIYINSYNKKLLLAWRANIDIQFVLDAYACAKYCAGYMLKAEGGISKLLRAAAKDAENGNTLIQNKLQKFARILINGSEISAQEAALFILGLPYTSCDRDDVYINTNPPSERVGILKSKEELQQLPDESDDICQKSLLDRYIQRPQELEDVCLADWGSLFTFKKGTPKRRNTYPIVDGRNDAENCRDFILLDNSGYVTKRTVRRIIRFRHFNKENADEYWREQIMLFIPWRNEEIEVFGVNAIEKAKTEMDLINQNSKFYYSSRGVDDGYLGQLLTEMENDEYRDESQEGQIDDEVILEDAQYADHCLGEKSTSTSSISEKFLAPKLIENAEFFTIMRTLNYKQRRIVMHVLHCLKSEKLPFYIFLTGGAGVGKSRVITAIVQSFLRFANGTGIPPSSFSVVVSAPTGKAAFNIFGMTCHCAFRLYPNQHGGEEGPLSEGVANEMRLRYEHVKLFIIDEISMISAKQLALIDKRLRQFFNPELPFGGKSVLAVGHLRQLPPIPGGTRHHVFKAPPSSGVSSIIQRNPDWEIFKFYELDEIMRQRGEFEFCKALNNMSEGIMDEKDIALFKSREIRDSLQPPKEAIWLFLRNKDCNDYNVKVHGSLDTEGAVSIAKDDVYGYASEQRKNEIKEAAKTFDRKDTNGIPYEVSLKVGALYFITTNIDVSDGLFNGATGFLRHIEYATWKQTGTRFPNRVWIEFENAVIGVNERAKNREKYIRHNIPAIWVPIERLVKTITKSHVYPGLEIKRNQLPLQGANGMTVAKSQGSSMPYVVVSMQRKMSRENLYVACSRATSRNGIFIDGVFVPPDHPGDNDDVSKEIEKLKQNPVNLTIRFSDVASQNKLYFHNVENFNFYKNDVAADPEIMSSSVIALVETHITCDFNANIPGFSLPLRISTDKRNGKEDTQGCLVYTKNGYTDISWSYAPNPPSNTHQIITLKMAGVVVFVCYKSPQFSENLFLEILSRFLNQYSGKNIILVGDLNMDMIRNTKLRTFFAEFDMDSKLGMNDITTNKGSQIDVCFSNFRDINAAIHETYYSYHKGIRVSW